MINDLNLKLSTRVSVMLTFTLALLLCGSLWWTPGLALAGVVALALLLLNLPVYQFFYRKRGTWFLLKMIPWHWLYFAYSGLAYGLGIVRYRLRQRDLLPDILRA
jgi:hypothetical protein